MAWHASKPMIHDNKNLQMNIQIGKIKTRPSPSPNNNNILTLSLSNVHHNHLLTLIFLLIIQTAPTATSQPFPAPPPIEPGKRSVAGVMVVVAVLFFISGFLSIYTRQCADRRPRTRRLDLSTLTFGGGNGRRPNMEPRGLNPDVIESFPTFLYDTVKGLMVAKEALACAVCLDEFQDDETLRLIPICNHVFHPTCIDPWLASNSTCPVCRANLLPRSEEEEEEEPPPLVVVEIPEEEEAQEHQQQNQQNDNNAVVGVAEESPKEKIILGRIRSCTMNRNLATRSRSTGFLFGLLFPPSDSNGRSSVERRCERFSVRLPEEVRRKLVVNTTLKRARSCVSLGRMGSGRSGYRTRSVMSGGGGGGGGGGRWEYQRFHGEDDQWGFAFTTPFFDTTSRRSLPDSQVVQQQQLLTSEVAASGDDRVLDERSSDHLCPGILASHHGG